MTDWTVCPHKFSPWFGPVLKCARCGASTMVSMDKNESKVIYMPMDSPYCECGAVHSGIEDGGRCEACGKVI